MTPHNLIHSAQAASQAAQAQAQSTLQAKNLAHDAMKASADALIAYVQSLE